MDNTELYSDKEILDWVLTDGRWWIYDQWNHWNYPTREILQRVMTAFKVPHKS